MLFHVGVMWRLDEVGLISGLDRVSSVSGGSITSGVLAMKWRRLGYDKAATSSAFEAEIVQPLRQLAGQNIDVRSVLSGIATPRQSVSDRVCKAYSRHLYGATKLEQLPDKPRFVFNASNLESGALMRFSKAYVADYRVGRILEPGLPLAIAVTASSAFPPFLSPCRVDFRSHSWQTERGNDLTSPRYRQVVSLSDGGVYDNLGLETVAKRFESSATPAASCHQTRIRQTTGGGTCCESSGSSTTRCVRYASACWSKNCGLAS